MKKLSMDELNRLSTDEFVNSVKMPVTVVLDNLRSLNNIGSVFRTADAFRVESIHLCGITAQPPHRDIQKTALGATGSVKWEYFPDFVPVPDHRIAVIFGNEVQGVGQEIIDLADECIEIPQMGTKHSLNVSVSAGIVLWSLFRNMEWS